MKQLITEKFCLVGLAVLAGFFPGRPAQGASAPEPAPMTLAGRPLIGTVKYPDVVSVHKGRDEGLVAVKLTFSAQAKDVEIRAARVFEEPLIPLDGVTSVKENVALAAALTSYSKAADKEDIGVFKRFLAAFPSSRWRAALQTNLAIIRRRQGYFTEALDRLEDAWALSKASAAYEQTMLANRALGELADLNARFGKFVRMKQLFDETEGRDVPGSAQTLLAGAKQGYWMMTNKVPEGFLCGPMAVNSVLNTIKKTQGINALVAQVPSTQQGTNLEQLRVLAKQVGLDYYPALKSSSGSWIVPSVVHWKVGHFAAITRQENGKYLIKDPTFGAEIWVSARALNSEASGYALVPSSNGALPNGWTSVDDIAANAIWGRGGANTSDKKATQNNDDCHKGMAAFGISKMLAALQVTDTPVTYQPPFGREMNFTVSFKYLEADEPSNYTFTNFGPFWESNWISYATVDGGGNVDVQLRDGGGETYDYSGYDELTGYFQTSLYSGAVLHKVGTNNYERVTPDGSREVYSQPDGTGRIFLKSVTDPQGNQVVLNYDVNMRLTSLVDGLGQSTTLTYMSDTIGAAGFYKVYRVTDPFTRYAEFTYDGALTHLIKIRDVIGIESSFTYGDNGLVSVLTTPYGDTQFYQYVPAEDGTARGLLIILPDNSRHCIESYRGHTLMTYEWDRKAMRMAPGDRTKAEQTHWLMSPDRIMMQVPDWTKRALENPIQYKYPQQSGPVPSNDPTDPVGTLHSLIGALALPSTVTQTTAGGDQVRQYAYNALGRVTMTVDPLGRKMEYAYALNNLDLLEVRQTKGGANDLLAKFTYNDQHLPLTATDASGRTTNFTYNSRGQLLTRTNAKSEVTTLTYDGNGYLTQVDGPLSGTSDSITLSYDSYGRIYTRTSHQGPTGLTDDYTLTYGYDALNRPTSIAYPDGTSEQRIYDRLDLFVTRDRLGRATTNIHNGLGQLVTQRDPAGGMTLFEWCSCGALKKLTDPMNHVTQWTYDIEGHMLTKTYADTSQQTYEYDTDSGRLTRLTDPLGNKSDYSYNLDDSVSGISFTAGTGAAATSAISYTYDPNYPRLATVGNGYGTYTYSYNAYATDFYGTPENGRGRMASIANSALSNATLSYAYDELGRLVDRRINGTANEATWSYDAAGRVSSWVNALGTFTPSYQNSGYGVKRLSSVALPNGLTTSYLWEDNSGDFRLKEIENAVGTTVLSQFDYVTDALGEVTQWTQATQSYALDYDLLQQLTGAILKNTGGSVLTQYFYSYDKAGNRLSEQVDDVVRSASYNSLNQLTGEDAGGLTRFRGTLDKPGFVTLNGVPATMTAGGTKFDGFVNLNVGTNTVSIVAKNASGVATSPAKQFQVTIPSGASQTLTYDGAGNETSDGTNTMTWDALNRLVKVTYASGAVSEFTYDAFGRRVEIVEKASGGAVTETRQFIWDGLKIAEFRGADNSLVRQYFDDGYRDVVGVANYYYTKDHLGSVREVTDNNGALTERYSYDPYGRTTKLSGADDSDFLYTGHYYHQASGLYLTYFRAYGPNLGRWLSRDPIQENGGLNLYRYVRNDPLKFIDLLGLNEFVPPSQIGPLYPGDSYYEDGLHDETFDYLGDYLGGRAVGEGLGALGDALSKAGQVAKKVCKFRGPEYGAWKDAAGDWQEGWHFHLGDGSGLDDHHLPQQFGTWWKNFKSVANRMWNQ